VFRRKRCNSRHAEGNPGFLAFCKINAEDCDEYIAAVHISNLFSRTVTYCYPKSATDSEAGLKAVLRSVRTWIAAHPETF
jgi:hypothetical protein